MKYIIDRFEENLAVLEGENKEMLNVPRGLLPDDAKEGDCLRKKNGIYTFDKEATALLKKDIDNLIDDLFI